MKWAAQQASGAAATDDRGVKDFIFPPRGSMLRRFPTLVAVATLSACSNTPFSPLDGFLTGAWGDTPPSGAQTTMTLKAADGFVSGTASAYQIEHVNPVSGTVSGIYSGGGFTLNFEFADGTKATWRGSLQTSGWLVGAWTQTAPTHATGTEAMVRS